jgi:hypothetical protein
MRTTASSLVRIRQQLLEGVLLRLARRADFAEFILRGGLLMRHWFAPFPRLVEDVDLVATFPFNLHETAERVLPIFAADDIGDGVWFDGEEIRAEGIWLGTGSPGMRFFVTGVVESREIDFHVDITFGPSPRPEPVLISLPTLCGQSASLWACQSEAVAGHKMQALWHRGSLSWRPKDLLDLYLLLTRVSMDPGQLRRSIFAYLADAGGGQDAPREVFGPETWWTLKNSAARWLDFVQSPAGRAAPKDLAEVVTQIRRLLMPILEERDL